MTCVDLGLGIYGYNGRLHGGLLLSRGPEGRRPKLTSVHDCLRSVRMQRTLSQPQPPIPRRTRLAKIFVLIFRFIVTNALPFVE